MLTRPAPTTRRTLDLGAPGLTATLDPVGRVALEGSLDAAGIEALRTVLDQALLSSGKVVAIDASRVTAVDPAAVSELLCYQLVAWAHSQELRLAPASRAVASLIDAFDLQAVLITAEERVSPGRG